MPYGRKETYTTIGTKPSWNLDASIVPFNATLACSFVTGPVSYKVQYSLDELGPTQTDADATWFDSVGIPAGTATDAVAALVSPVTMIRIVIATLTAGSITMQVRQGLSTN